MAAIVKVRDPNNPTEFIGIPAIVGADGPEGPQGIPGVVQSVNGYSDPDITLDTDDVGEGLTHLYYTDARVKARLTMPKCRIKMAATQTIPDNTDARLELNTIDYDTNQMKSDNPTIGKVVIKTAGYYTIGYTVSFAPNSAGSRSMHIRVNGVARYAPIVVSAVNAQISIQLATFTILHLAVGDYIEGWVWQNSGASLVAGSQYGEQPPSLVIHCIEKDS